jgi:hypothetical protein
MYVLRTCFMQHAYGLGFVWWDPGAPHPRELRYFELNEAERAVWSVFPTRRPEMHYHRRTIPMRWES